MPKSIVSLIALAAFVLAAFGYAGVLGVRTVSEEDTRDNQLPLDVALENLEQQETPNREEFARLEGVYDEYVDLLAFLDSEEILPLIGLGNSYWLQKRRHYVAWDLAINKYTVSDLQSAREHEIALLQQIYLDDGPASFALTSEVVVIGRVKKVKGEHGFKDGFLSSIVVEVEKVLNAREATIPNPLIIREASGRTPDGQILELSSDIRPRVDDRFVFFLSNVLYRYSVLFPDDSLHTPLADANKLSRDVFVQQFTAEKLTSGNEESLISSIQEKLRMMARLRNPGL